MEKLRKEVEVDSGFYPVTPRAKDWLAIIAMAAALLLGGDRLINGRWAWEDPEPSRGPLVCDADRAGWIVPGSCRYEVEVGPR
jgi:hypothetical protein